MNFFIINFGINFYIILIFFFSGGKNIFFEGTLKKSLNISAWVMTIDK
jgi:hypothetical protein